MILIDSSVLIAAEKGDIDLEGRLTSVGPGLIAAVTVSEILHGVHRANSERRRAERLQFVEYFLSTFPTLPFDLNVARLHSAVWADLERGGIRIPPHDMIIAATALYYDVAVATRDKRSFPRIPDLDVLVWD